MNDEVDMRHYGGLRKLHAGHLRHLRARLPRDHRRAAVRRASSPRTRSSRPPSAQAAAKGWILGGAALLGAGITAFYMTRVMLMTFFGEKRWQPTRTHDRIRTSRRGR